MAYRNLDEFLARLEQEGEVRRVVIDSAIAERPDIPARFVDTVHIFEDGATGSRIVTNLFGTRQRIEAALRVESLQELADKLGALLELGKPGSFGAMMSQGIALFSALRTNTNRRAPQLYEGQPYDVWRESIPASFKDSPCLYATLHSGEPSRYMRPVSFDFDADRLRLVGAPPLIVGEKIALVIGGDPAFLLAAMTPLPDLIHRSYYASWLRGRPLETMRLSSLDFDVPSNVEVVVVATVRHERPEHRNHFFDFVVDGRRLDLDVETVWTRSNPITLEWSRREYFAVRDSLRVIFQPLLRVLLPQSTNIVSYAKLIENFWLSDSSA